MDDDGAPADRAGGSGYPPEPWHLRGRLLLSVMRVPRSSVPRLAETVPPGHLPVSLGRDVLLGLAFVEYTSDGEVVYDELLTAVPTRPVGRLAARVTIPQIWVTTAVSVAGGRELWAIPKERCEVVRHSTASAVDVEVRAEGVAVAELSARIGRRLLPGRLPIPLTTAQRTLPLAPTARSLPPRRPLSRRPLSRRQPDPSAAADAAIISRNRVAAQVRTMRARWRIDPNGPLGHLAGRRPLLSVALTDASIVFGQGVER